MSELKEKIIEEIKKIYDPEIPVNIYDLGLIYNVVVDENNKVIHSELVAEITEEPNYEAALSALK